MEIFVSGAMTEAQAARLQAIAGDDGLHVHGSFDPEAAVDPAFARCEVAFGNLPPAWLAEAPALRWMQLESVGFGEYADLNWDELGQRLTLTNLAGFFAEPVAESALAGILALYRGLDRMVALQGAGDWQGDALRPGLRTLKGATVVLFGYGAINRRLEELLAPFGCVVVSFGSAWRAETLDLALKSADIVVSTVPDTPATRGVFSRQRLALLGADALFLNFGRGSAVDEAALADALGADRLGSAVIDVTLEEPLPPEHRFWTCPNLILTQHSGGGSRDEVDRKIEVFADNLARYRRGKPLAGTINWARGY